MDFITELPVVVRGGKEHNGVLVCVDKYSKYCKLIPVAFGEGLLTAPAVAALFFEHVVRPFGVPTAVLSDCDPRFTSGFWQALWKILGTRVLLSSAYHP